MADAPRDGNFIPTLLGASNVDGKTPVVIYANPTTHRLLVDSGLSAGTATTWSGNGNTTTVVNAAVTATSIILIMTATPAAGNWGIVCGSGSFVITSSDAESNGLAFTYKVFG